MKLVITIIRAGKIPLWLFIIYKVFLRMFYITKNKLFALMKTQFLVLTGQTEKINY